MATIDQAQLFSILSKEKETGELLPLPTDFYQQIESLILSLSSSDVPKQEEANLQKMVAQLKEKRRQKILIYLAYNRPLPRPVPQEEENLYNEILKILNKDASKTSVFKVKILTDLPEIVTPEGKKLGPFSKDQVVELTDRKDVDFILVNKIGEEV